MNWTRRAFLGGAAGAGLSIFFPRPKIAGGIVGASADLGHRLREGDLPEPSAELDVPVAIFGGGIAGLGAAWALDRAGRQDFLAFEMESEAGGNARGGRNAVAAYPWGAHYVPMPNREATAVRELLQDLGVIRGYDADGAPRCDERMLCFDPQERVFADGVWSEGLFPHRGASREDEAQLRDFREAMARMRGFAIPADRSDPEHDALDGLAMADYLESNGWTSSRLRWYVDYACRDDFGCAIEATSAWAGVHYFASRQFDDRPVLTWPEGNGWIARRLAERAGSRLRCGQLVARVWPEADRVVAHVLDAASGRVTEVRSRAAIFALPQYVARHVLGREAAGFTYAPWVVANVTVDRLPDGAGFPPAYDNVIVDSPGLGYVIATHQSPATAPGASVLTYYRAFTGDPSVERAAMLHRPWGEWVEEILADLRGAHPRIADVVRRVDVMLWGHGMIRPTPGFVRGAARRRAAEPMGALRFAHSDLSGLSLFEEALTRGVTAAEDL